MGAIVGWVLKFLGQLFLGRLAQIDKDHANRELGRVQAERDQAITALEAKGAMDKIAAQRTDWGTILDDMKEGKI